MFSNLPPELVDGIAVHLDKQALQSLRLTCRALDIKSRWQYEQKVFHTINTDLSPDSVRGIQAIAAHDQYGLAVKKLHVTTFVTDADQASNAIEALRAVLTIGLPNCTEYEITDLYQEAGVDPDLKTATLMLLLLFMATPDPKFSSMRMNFENADWANVEIQGLGRVVYHPRFAASWRALRSLRLDHSAMGHAETLLSATLISKATGLETLILDLGRPIRTKPSTGHEQGMPSASEDNDYCSDLLHLTHMIQLPALTHLELRNAHAMTRGVLVNALRLFGPNLRELRLSGVGLSTTAAKAAGAYGPAGTWPAVLRDLAESRFPELKKVYVSELGQGLGDWAGDDGQLDVCFCEFRSQAWTPPGGRFEVLEIHVDDDDHAVGVEFEGEPEAVKDLFRVMADCVRPDFLPWILMGVL